MPSVSLRCDLAGENAISRVKYHIAITTLNRQTDTGERIDRTEKENYLLPTLRGLYNHAGLGLLDPRNYKVTIFDSGSRDKQFLEPVYDAWPNITISSASKRLNLVENTLRALETASRDSEYVCLVQDDLTFRWWSFLGLNDLISEVEENRLGYLTLIRVAGTPSQKLVRCDPDAITGACFLVFRSVDIDGLLRHPVCRQWRQGFRFDYMLREWARETGRAIYCPTESWIQHIGDYSSLREREERRVPLFTHAPPIGCRAVKKTLRKIGLKNMSIDFADLLPTGFPAQNRQWSSVNGSDAIAGLAIRRFNKTITLNDVAATTWKLCNHTCSFGELLAELALIYEMAEGDIREEVSNLLLELLDEGALCVGRSERAIGITTLMRMIAYATPQQIQDEIKRRNTLHFTDSLGQTVMHYAARTGREEIVSTLLAYNPSLETADHAGHTPGSLLKHASSRAP